MINHKGEGFETKWGLVLMNARYYLCHGSGGVGIPPELVVPIGLLEVIGGIFLLVGVVTRIATYSFHNRDDKCHSYRQVVERICRRVRTRIAVHGYRYKPTLDRSRKNIY